MSARPALRVIDGNGELVETDDPQETIRALESALTRAERSNRALKAQLAAERQKARNTHPIDDAFHDWRDKLVEAGRKGMKKAKLSPDRIDAMGEMFEAGYTLEDFRLVGSGIAACQFVVYGRRQQHGPEKDRKLDIGWVCEKAARFEEAARLGAIVEKARAES